MTRKTILAFSQNTQHQPDYYHIEGFLVGLATLGTEVRVDKWLVNLFGDYLSIDRYQLQALMELHEQCKVTVAEATYKLPKQCALSKKDIAASLVEDAPLPRFCTGFIAGLSTVLNDLKLPAEHKEAIFETQALFAGFTSFDRAKRTFSYSEPTRTFEQEALLAKRRLASTIHALSDTLGMLPFDLEDFGDSELEGFGYNEFNDEELEAKDDAVSLLLQLDDVNSLHIIDEFIKIEEQAFITPAFKQQNEGHFWLIHETRPYMAVRFHKARLLFESNQFQKACTELEALLILNPNDNQACRYLYANCLVMLEQWDKLKVLLTEYQEGGIFMRSAEALMRFALEGESAELNAIKQSLIKANKHFVKILTGQEKVKLYDVLGYTLGSKEEVITYIEMGGKKAWLSVEGSLFWLRNKKK
ncbi:UPF0149 family protein [Pseudoalteromonas luteoviolacea]|uniref:Tetratricopeptide repeat protein n=1 Tax=Pseudoalteromonas luteoviolacea NCIMB 1942 TaxID=1365253 RepID=A0A167HPQ6_9GAMM|nr:UPF0149 family protein [Pseudoalteromonas luteoviolacea]KZN58365.1 hypothetical protein N482_22535 [Pseudoalteromonas luteoviolacea NCIMB 1942]KZW98916.1 hypothetical protein JL49_20390 [Pseudoalteromonas luteoviolacea]